MDVITLSNEQYQELLNRLDTINEKLSHPAKDPKENFITDSDFLRLMKISKSTAKRWRDQGKISFAQIDRKIYYRLSDIEEMMMQHSAKAF